MNSDYYTALRYQASSTVQKLSIPYNDNAPDAGLNNLVHLAAVTCQAQAGLLLLTDGNEALTKASYNFSAPAAIYITDLYNAACQQQNHAATAHPLFTKYGYPCFIASPLYTGDEQMDGYLCLLYNQPVQLSSIQQECLPLLIKQITTELSNSRRQQPMHMQAAQHMSHEQVQHLFKRATDAVVITGLDGNIIQWNPKAEKTFGWTAGEATGKNFEALCIAAQSISPYQDYKATCDDSSQLAELTALHKNGSELIIGLGLSCVSYNEQEYCVIFMSDVTEHKQITSSLDKQKAFYEHILNKIPTDIAVFDANHRYVFVNPGAISNAVYRKAIIGKDDYEYAAYRGREPAVADKRRSQFLEVKRTGQEIRWEDGIRAPDGKMITHLRRLFPVHNEQGEIEFVIGYGMDITDRMAMEEKQSMLVKQLSAQNAQLVDFCNIVSHNLRGPLVNMSMLVQFIKETNDTEEQYLLIDKLQPVIDNLHTTFNELVESIQIKQDVGIPSEQISLDDCMQRTLAGLEMEIKKTQAIIETDFEEAGILYYPSKYLFSIFHNLIGNSLKYSSPNRKPHIRIATRRNGTDIILSVADNGLGLDIEKHKESLFKIGKVFHRNPNAKGFGLFMTKTQVEAMDGRIWAESTPGEGTTFFVEFTKQSL